MGKNIPENRAKQLKETHESLSVWLTKEHKVMDRLRDASKLLGLSQREIVEEALLLWPDKHDL